ncbi:MAG: hypothetical protein QM689_00450 [Oscillospiraceae bacterium]
MRIVSWNCNGAFRKKIYKLMDLKADIYIIQECENPKMRSEMDYQKFAINHLWIGANKNRGLGIFCDQKIKLEPLKWDSYGLEYFLPCRINDSFTLLGVWACGNYIEDYYVYQRIYSDNLYGSIISGDFNSNAIWDRAHKRRNHTAVVNQLENIGLTSAYHWHCKQLMGEETQATFYHRKKINKSYHIDYFFCQQSLEASMKILNRDEWLPYSDHIPLVVDIHDSKICSINLSSQK